MPDFVESIGAPLFAHRLRRLSETLVDAVGAWLPEAGVSAPPKAGSTLLLLAAEGPMSVTEIASRLRLSHPLIVRLVRELEALGLTRTEQDPSDGRRRPVWLTQAGRAQAQRFRAITVTLAEVYARLFSDAGIDGLVLVERLEGALRYRDFGHRLREFAHTLA
jgi:DNA-binding MarR family transcriptional regulator